MKVLKRIVATDVQTGIVVNDFATFAEAARWMQGTKKADCRGHEASYRTILTNIKNCVCLPTLYTQFYGFTWTTKENEKGA